MSNSSASGQNKLVDRIVGGTMLAIYAAVWVTGFALVLDGAWLITCCTAAGYVGMHLFAMTYRGRCWLCADPMALPGALVGFIIGVWSTSALGELSPSLVSRAIGAYPVVYFGGHLVVLVVLATADALQRLFWKPNRRCIGSAETRLPMP